MKLKGESVSIIMATDILEIPRDIDTNIGDITITIMVEDKED